MTARKVTRWQAAGVHLLISVAIAAVALAVMLFVWYPWPLFDAEGGTELLFILVGVDVIIGPLLTLVVFRQGKRSLRFDLAVIGITQLAALCYGVYIVFLARPAFLVFVVDRFEVTHVVDLDPERMAQAKYPEFRKPGIAGPRLTVAEWPADPVEKSNLGLKLLNAGLDLQAFPAYWSPYAERRRVVLARALTLERVRAAEPAYARVIDEWLARSGRKEADLRYVPLRARKAWVAVLIDAKTAEPVKMLIVEKI